MDQAISAAEANCAFSRILREVREGRSYIVTAHGRPVARILPVDDVAAARVAARTVLLRRLRAQGAKDVGRWTRDELYER